MIRAVFVCHSTFRVMLLPTYEHYIVNVHMVGEDCLSMIDATKDLDVHC